MAEVEVRQLSEQKNSGSSKELLTAQLDDLLEQYLSKLDAYQQAHQQLTAYLSSGYMSIAQANFNNARTRFGQDYYDERMQASRKITLTGDECKVTFSVPAPTSGLQNTQQAETKGTAQSAASSNPGSDSTSSEPDNERQDQKDKSSSMGDKLLVDPIRWFGVLVPPALHSAKSSFVSAVEGPVAHLATLAMDLRKLEMDIGRLRKQIKKL